MGRQGAAAPGDHSCCSGCRETAGLSRQLHWRPDPPDLFNQGRQHQQPAASAYDGFLPHPTQRPAAAHRCAAVCSCSRWGTGAVSAGSCTGGCGPGATSKSLGEGWQRPAAAYFAVAQGGTCSSSSHGRRQQQPAGIKLASQPWACCCSAKPTPWLRAAAEQQPSTLWPRGSGLQCRR